MDLCSATSIESSRRDLLNDMAEHTHILKNRRNMYYLRFSFTPKSGIELPKTGVSFILCKKLIFAVAQTATVCFCRHRNKKY